MTGRDIIEMYFGAINTEDWEALGPLFTDDVVLEATGARSRSGRDEVAAYFPAVLAGYTAHHDLVKRRITDGSTVVAEIHFSGRTSRGQLVEFEAVDVFDLRDGLIARLSSWYDTARVKAALSDERYSDRVSALSPEA